MQIAIATGICVFALAAKAVQAAVIVSSLVAYSSGGSISTTETSWTESNKDFLRNLTLSGDQEVISGGSTEKIVGLGESGYSQNLNQDDRDIISHQADSNYQSNGLSIHESKVFLQADGTPNTQAFCDAASLIIQTGGSNQSSIPYSEDAISKEISITNILDYKGQRSINQLAETPDSLTHEYAQTGDGTWTDWIRTTSMVGQGNQTDLILKQNHYEHNVRNGTFDVNRSFSFTSFKTAFDEAVTPAEES